MLGHSLRRRPNIKPELVPRLAVAGSPPDRIGIFRSGLFCCVNSYSSKKYNEYNLNFHPFEVVFRYRDPQLQVIKMYLNIHILNQNMCDSS